MWLKFLPDLTPSLFSNVGQVPESNKFVFFLNIGNAILQRNPFYDLNCATFTMKYHKKSYPRMENQNALLFFNSKVKT